MSDAPLNMLDELRARLERVRQNVETVFLGKPHAVRQLLVGLLSRGHVLIDDAPGVGKTVLARALAKSLDLRFSRIQLTPDLLPSDLLGVSVYNDKSGLFEFKPGPIFANVVLADEINRTTPRTQSALLEAMNEGQVSMDGRTMVLDPPFFVIATQNPYEFEGTYYLPENQPDRAPLHDLQPVMCADDLLALQERADDVHVDDSLVNYALEVIEATREHDQLELGISPRGTVALMRAAKASALLDGRDYVVPDDLKALLGPVFAHRVVTKSFLQSGDTASAEQLIHEIVARVPAPA
jgi:MoxR-like ATPase